MLYCYLSLDKILFLIIYIFNYLKCEGGHFRSGFKISDQVQGQGAGRSKKRSPAVGGMSHLKEACNTAIGPQMGF